MKRLIASGPPVGMATFYTGIHRNMLRNTDILARPYPTHAEWQRYLERITPLLSPTARLLDAGCGGMAVASLHAAASGLHAITACDINHSSLLMARKCIQERGMEERIVLLRDDVARLPFADATFDLICCAGVAHHTPDPTETMRELARVLRPNGRLYLSLYCFQGSWFDWLITGLRLIGRFLPHSLALRLMGMSPALNNFVLDHMHVPILWLFTRASANQLLDRAGLVTEQEYPSAMDPLLGRRWLFKSATGDGLLRVWELRKPGPKAPTLRGDPHPEKD